MASLCTAFFASSLMFEGRIHGLIEDILLTNGRKIIQAYQAAPSAELVPFMQNLSGLTGTVLQLYDQNGTPLLVDKQGLLQVDSKRLERVLAGGVARHNHSEENHPPVIGLPFEVEGKPYALFLTVEQNDVELEIMNSMHLMYVIIVLFGSLLILVAARYLVQPIRRLTEATRRMAKGEFDLELRTNRKDELGQLTQSFHEMARELSKLDRMRQDFVASVSHEIQSPLTSITGFSKALKQKQMSEEDRQRYLTIIEEESERLSRLSQNLLRLSFLQHQDRPVQVSSYRLDEQLRRVVIALEPLWTAKDIEVEVRLEPIVVQADEDQLGQVWTNLLGNGIKFTPAHGKIQISAGRNEQGITVAIADNGIGIPEEERTNIFKPFHQVDKARNSASKGNGLGLSIVKQIVDIHKGEIRVSGRPGGGSVFTVMLPQ